MRTRSLVLGFAMCLWLPLGGQIYFIEMVAPLVILMSQNAQPFRDRYIRMATALAALWASGAAITDLYRVVPYSALLAHQATVWVLLADLILLRIWIGGDLRRAAWVMLGYAGAIVTGYFLQPNVYAGEEPWKFGYGLALTFSTIALIGIIRPVVAVAVPVLGSVAAIHLTQGFRSQALILAVAGVVAAANGYGIRRPWAVLGAALAALLVGQVVYSNLASSGSLGADAQHKFDVQSQSAIGLLGGRPEFIFSGAAIYENPILGLGADAEDTGHVVDNALEVGRDLGLDLYGPRLRNGQVPLHSHILGSWAEAGILAVPFWAWVLLIFTTGLANLSRLPASISPLVAFCLTQAIWDTLFSPLGGAARFQFALEVVILIAAYESLRENEVLDRHNIVQSGAVPQGGR